MTGTALVGPLRRQHFGAHVEVVIPYTPPRNTLDPRFRLCFDHHVACDCREASLQEVIQEYRGECETWTRAARTVLAGHRTFDWDDDGDRPGNWRGAGPLACQCHGCQIVRAAHASAYGLGADDTGRITPPEGTR